MPTKLLQPQPDSPTDSAKEAYFWGSHECTTDWEVRRTQILSVDDALVFYRNSIFGLLEWHTSDASTKTELWRVQLRFFYQKPDLRRPTSRR